MATLLTKKSDTASSVPLAADLTNAAGGAELAVNTADKRLYSKTSGGTVVELGTNPSSMTLPNGTANGIPYLNGSKVLTSGSALTFDGASLVVGNAGTVLGAASLTLGSHLSVANAGRYYLWAASNAYSWSMNAPGDAIAWYNNSGSEQMRLTSTGLGIGTSSVDGKLVVYGTAGTNPYSHFKDASGADFFIQSVGNSDCRTGTASNHPWLFFTNGTEKMRLDTSGNLGLGVTPSAWSGYKSFDLPGAGYISSGGGSWMEVMDNVYYNAGYKYKSNGYASHYLQQNSGHFWYTAPSGTAGNAISFTQAMTLDASGNLLVGTTSIAGAGGLTIQPNTSAGATAMIFNRASSTGTSYPLDFRNGGSTVGYVSYTNLAVVYATTSDHRLKTVLGSITDSGTRIDALEPIEYEWKSDGSRTRGFLAHKFQEVYAGSVTGTKDAVDVEGKPVYQAMQAGSSEVIADLVAEIQSLRKRLAAAGI